MHQCNVCQELLTIKVVQLCFIVVLCFIETQDRQEAALSRQPERTVVVQSIFVKFEQVALQILSGTGDQYNKIQAIINFLMQSLCQTTQNNRRIDVESNDATFNPQTQLPQLKIVSLGKQEMMAHFRAGNFAGMKLCAYNPSNNSLRRIQI